MSSLAVTPSPFQSWSRLIMLPDFLAVVTAAVASWCLVRALIPSLSRRLLDQPNERSSHRQPTPSGGGVAFVLVTSLASALAWLARSGFASAPLLLLAAPVLALPLALVGFLDDRHNLPASWRYSMQLSTALVVVLTSPLVAPSVGLLPLLALLVIAVTAVINFTNFMDGLDGLVAGCMGVVMTAAAIQLGAPWPIWALVGALLGFLLWNWSPAKVFMGDVGSTFLGAVFSVLVFQASSWFEALALLLLATPLLGDACICVPRRLMAGQRVFQAHRLHLFQRLHQAGWPHARVSSLYIAATAVLAIALLWGGLPWVITIAAFELLIGIWLDQQVAVPFAVASCR
jgi:Fuc2NAc and GlcNAc transferase